MIRSLAALLAGWLTTAVLYVLGTAALFVAAHGIPLGASPGPPGAGDLAANLVLAVLAAGAGGWVAARVAGRRAVALALAIVLAAGALWGFSKPESQWPGWYPLALAVLGTAGAVAGGRLARS